MNILTLGAGGFIGSHLVNYMLQQQDYQIVAYDLYDEKLQDNQEHPQLTIICGDIRDEHDKIVQFVEESDLVIDLIAHANPSLYITKPLDVVDLNFHENLFVTKLCIKYKKRLIQFSTCEVYGKTVVPLVKDKIPDPDNPDYALFSEDSSHMILGPVNKHRWIYSSGKQLLERVLHAYGLEGRLNYTIIRPFNFIGPRIDYLPSEHDGNPRVFSHFLHALLEGSTMYMVNGGLQQRTYTLIDDAVACIGRIIENPNGICDRQIFNVGNPNNELTIRQLGEKMMDTYKKYWWDGRQALSSMVDISGEQFYGTGYDDSDRRIPDIRKAQTLLQWQPKYGIDEVIRRSMAYWCEQSM